MKSISTRQEMPKEVVRSTDAPLNVDKVVSTVLACSESVQLSPEPGPRAGVNYVDTFEIITESLAKPPTKLTYSEHDGTSPCELLPDECLAESHTLPISSIHQSCDDVLSSLGNNKQVLKTESCMLTFKITPDPKMLEDKPLKIVSTRSLNESTVWKKDFTPSANSVNIHQTPTMMRMGSMVLFTDILANTETDSSVVRSGSSIRREGNKIVYRFHNTTGEALRHLENDTVVAARSRDLDEFDMKTHDVDNRNARGVRLRGDRSCNDCQEHEEFVDWEKRRSGRIRKKAKSSEKDKELLMSKILHAQYLVVKRREVSDEGSEDRWPTVFSSVETVEIASTRRTRRRRLSEAVPMDPLMPFAKRQRLNGKVPASPRKSSALTGLQSPQKATWFSYKRSVSRVGEQYQVPSLPPVAPIVYSVQPSCQG